MSECRVINLKELGISKELFDYIYSMGEQDGRADVIEELLSIKNPCDDCYMEFCETCRHNGEYSANIQAKLEQLKEQTE